MTWAHDKHPDTKTLFFRSGHHSISRPLLLYLWVKGLKGRSSHWKALKSTATPSCWHHETEQRISPSLDLPGWCGPSSAQPSIKTLECAVRKYPHSAKGRAELSHWCARDPCVRGTGSLHPGLHCIMGRFSARAWKTNDAFIWLLPFAVRVYVKPT